MINYAEIQPMLVGRWEEILSAYGVDLPKWQGKNTINTACPCCGGTDRAHWRHVEGRIALYCRHCASESMKSPETVLQEVCGLSFGAMVQELAQFVGMQDEVQITKAKNQAKAAPKHNMPTDHKQDHKKAVEFIEGCELVAQSALLARYGVQSPIDVHQKNGYPVFPIANSEGAIVNLACISERGVSFIAGGHSYAAWYTISQCDERLTGGVVYATSLIRGLHHWWKTGQEVRVTFHDFATLYLLTNGDASEESIIDA